MKIAFNIKSTSLACLLLAMGFLSSCEKDKDETGTDKVVLLNFGPSGAKHGEEIVFVGYNLNKVTAVELVGATVAASEFKEQTAESIKFDIPMSAEEGFATLRTPGGDIVSKTKINFSVPVVITSVTEESRPGDNITIKGEFLNWIKEIKFPTDLVVTTFVSQTINELVVQVPENAQTGKLIISSGGTDPLEIETDVELKVTLPVVTAVGTNPVLHAANLTITGTNLDLTKKILFTGVATPVTAFESQSATEIVVKVPGSTKKGKITLEAASGIQTVSDLELDVILPAISNMTPNPIDPGANITITGTHFELVTSVGFDNAPAVTSFISQTATQIVAKVPMGILRGKVTLGVLNSTLTVQSPDILEINGSVPAPTIAFPFYDDAVTSNWNGWIGGGWGGTSDRNNTSPVRAGTKSVKIDYVGGYGSPLQLGGASVSLAAYSTFKVSIYGGPGSAGKKINLGINAADAYTITVVEGVWTDYSIPISSLTGSATLTEIWVKEYNGSGGFTVYVDAMGLN